MALLLGLLLANQLLRPFQFRLRLDPARMVHIEGLSYQHPVDPRPPFWGMIARSDSSDNQSGSDIELTLDGTVLGPPHSRHDEIAALGGGRFSHWRGQLYFSSPTGTDPRSDGLDYAIAGRFVAPIWLLCTVFAGAMLSFAIARGGRAASVTSAKTRSHVVPLLVLGGFVLVNTVLLHQAHQSPVVLNSTDAGNIAGWVAGSLYPDRMAEDPLVSDPRNTDFYVSVFVPMVRFFAWLSGDIGRGYLWTGLPALVLQVLGFYVLGFCLTRSRTWAFLLSAMTLSPIWVWGQNDLFGQFWVPLVRNAFDAAIPYLLLLFLLFAHRSRLLPLLFGACGLTIYIHPVSAPAMAAGLWLGAFALRDSAERFLPRLAWMVAGGVVFVASALPFTVPFLASFSGGEPVNPAQGNALAAFQKANGPIFYDAFLALERFVLETGAAAWPVWLIGLAGLCASATGRLGDRREGRFFLLFILGCLIASVGLCAIDQAISHWRGTTPTQLDLIRGLRLIIPATLVGFVMTLAAIQRSLARLRLWPSAMLGPMVAALILVQWWSVYPNRISDMLGVASIPSGHREQDTNVTRLLAFLRQRPVQGRYLPIGDATVGLAVRYAGLQPLAFIPNDMNALFYAGSPLVPEWTRLLELNREMREGSDPAQALTSLIESSKASHVVVEDGALPPPAMANLNQSARAAHRFGRWSLYDLAQ